MPSDAARGGQRALPTKASATARPFHHVLTASMRRGRADATPTKAPPARPSASAHHGKAVSGDGETKKAKDARELRDERDDKSSFDPLDPETRRAAQLAPPSIQQQATVALSPHEAAAPAEVAHARVSLEELLPQLVKRIAWAGDKRKGTVQLELGAGRHAGTTVTVHSDHGRVRVEVHGNSADVADLRERIDARLRRYGLDVDSVT